MSYELQKIIMKNCTVYNILHEGNILGHVLESPDSNLLVQTSDIPIIPLAESFGFEGNYLILNDTETVNVVLTPTPDFKPLYEFKTFNYSDYFLSETDT